MKIYFRIYMRPVPKARARTLKNGYSYTPQPTVDAEKLVRDTVITRGVPYHTGPVRMDFHFRFKIPKSWSKKKKAAMLGKLHTQRPDRNNLEKLVEDALNGVAYKDDSQVCVGEYSKRWAEKDCVIFTIESAADDEGTGLPPLE